MTKEQPMSDMELALALEKHLWNPCTDGVTDLYDMWRREAERQMQADMKDMQARKVLQEALDATKRK